MSRDLTAEEVAALARPTLTLVPCWIVEDALGNVSRHTALDADLVIDKAGLAGTYLATKPVDGTSYAANDNLGVDNLEVRVPLDPAGITLGAIRARMFDGMRFTIFLADWRYPTNTGIIVQRGVIGNARLETESVAVFELRSLKQLLQQNLLPLVSRTCRAVLGDAACGIGLSEYMAVGSVDSVGTQRRIFTAADVELAGSSSELPAGWYDYGAIDWLTGGNEGLRSEVKQHSSGGVLELLLPTPFNITAGDTFTVHAGCDRARGTCKDKFANLVNFQGEPDAPDAALLLAEAPT